MQRDETAFVSYAREDRSLVKRIATVLDLLSFSVWLDESLSGGQAWWDEILRQIRGCDVVIVAISPSMVRSVACLAEVTYAVELGKPILPIRVESVRLELLPRSIALLQFVDLVDDSQESALRLAGALRRLPAGIVPATPPVPPPPPISFLNQLADSIRAPSLDPNTQLALVARLESAEPAEAGTIRELAQLMLARQDLLYAPAKSLERLLDRIPEPPSDESANAAQVRDDDQSSLWNVRLLSSHPNSRVLTIRHDGHEWTVDFVFPRWTRNKVFVDGRLVQSAYVLPMQFSLVEDSRTWSCTIEVEGYQQLKGTRIMLGSRVIYADGSMS
jgi:hypothetical protein